MKIKLYQVDAFAEKPFEGNPAAVCPLTEWLTDETMQNIAMENNLSETAFFIPHKKGFDLRWFTPKGEVNLCGHATLATAYVLFECLNYDENVIEFHSKSGLLKVKKLGNSEYQLDFPVDNLKKVNAHPMLLKGLNVTSQDVYQGVSDLMVILPSEDQVRSLNPDFSLLKQLDSRGIIVTAPGENVDFVSRCFYPAYGVDEDPVTGSAHTTMAPYWSKVIGKVEMSAIQVSPRQGVLKCLLFENRVLISGKAVLFMEGEISI